MSGSTLDERGLPKGMAFRADLEVTPREARAMLESGRALVIDVRTQPEWDLVHVAGTELIPLDQIAARHDEVEPEGREVLLLCHHGRRSLDAANILRATGRKELAGARSVAGGIEVWAIAADTSVARYERGPGGMKIRSAT